MGSPAEEDDDLYQVEFRTPDYDSSYYWNTVPESEPEPATVTEKEEEE